MKHFVPVFEWLPKYKISYLKSDVVAGITVGILLIPQGMAYALIAGLPPVFGLYAALVPQIIYAIMGTSRQLAVGPVAMDSLLVASSLAALSLTSLDSYIAMAVFLALFTGVIQLLMGFLKMGFLVNFLSKPVISGFTSAVAIIIGLSQLKHFTGLSFPRTNGVIMLLKELFNHSSQIHVITLFMGILAMGIIVFIKKFVPKIPSALMVVFLGIVSVYFLGLNHYGVEIVGNIPKGLPIFKWPSFNDMPILTLAPMALTLALVGYMEASSISKSLEEQNEDYEVDANQELVAIGFSNMIGSLFQSYPSTGGFARTAVNHQAGAKTGIASLVAAAVVGFTLLFLTPLFYYLPLTVLAAMILVAVFYLIDVKYPIQLYKHQKDEFYLLIITFIITLFLGITQGILVGIVLSLILVIYRTSQPHIAVLARVENSNYFKNVARFNVTTQRDDLLIVRFDAQLYFGNKDYFKKKMHQLIAVKKETLKAVIINAEAITYIDSSASVMLMRFIKELKDQNIIMMITGAIGPTRDVLFKNNIVEVLGKENLFVRTYEAVDCFDGIICKDDLQNKICQQTKNNV
ncbi:SulP family inorganic anion transporter [Wenyingzhuangia marina]|uniref:Sulfate permease, SulP family n=1 Tax=Wenyingzhuangia marina TaxID=1195760 RepID=A0A1M5UMV5_9FLAO|nr:solute carrier family 26 protein [Wenyingzhuangia marina]GGF66792.1 sodium-independent anion transporter [Wenyingzhuangia marina]SHH64277.1 sulfate permease, SulP family [Wenyingzhuangia marina]